MDPNERGRHCTKCSYDVVDFTSFTDKELYQYFQNTKGRVCGRLNNHQVERPIQEHFVKKRSLVGSLKFVASLLLGTALVVPVKAKETITQSTKEEDSSDVLDVDFLPKEYPVASHDLDDFDKELILGFCVVSHPEPINTINRRFSSFREIMKKVSNGFTKNVDQFQQGDLENKPKKPVNDEENDEIDKIGEAILNEEKVRAKRSID